MTRQEIARQLIDLAIEILSSIDNPTPSNPAPPDDVVVKKNRRMSVAKKHGTVKSRNWPLGTFSRRVRARAKKQGVPAKLVTKEALQKAYDTKLTVANAVRQLKKAA